MVKTKFSEEEVMEKLLVLFKTINMPLTLQSAVDNLHSLYPKPLVLKALTRLVDECTPDSIDQVKCKDYGKTKVFFYNQLLEIRMNQEQLEDDSVNGKYSRKDSCTSSQIGKSINTTGYTEDLDKTTDNQLDTRDYERELSSFNVLYAQLSVLSREIESIPSMESLNLDITSATVQLKEVKLALLAKQSGHIVKKEVVDSYMKEVERVNVIYLSRKQIYFNMLYDLKADYRFNELIDDIGLVSIE